MTMRPRIAIPEPTSTDEAYNERSFPQYVHSIESAGGIAVRIRLSDTREERQALVDSCDGVLLPGSPADLDPARYGEASLPETAARDNLREAADDFLLGTALQQGKPILGICYGLQSINVWHGGSLVQHLPHTSAVNHEPGRTVERAHPVSVAPDSGLSQVGEEGGTLFVNSSHHQAVGRPGKGLKVVATSPEDGVVEALETTRPNQFLLGVQWHPERTYDTSAASRAIFTAFLEAARCRRQ
jgi:putative glutamine amidotransferase